MHVFGVLYTAEMYGKLKRSTTFNATPRMVYGREELLVATERPIVKTSTLAYDEHWELPEIGTLRPGPPTATVALLEVTAINQALQYNLRQPMASWKKSEVWRSQICNM